MASLLSLIVMIWTKLLWFHLWVKSDGVKPASLAINSTIYFSEFYPTKWEFFVQFFSFGHYKKWRVLEKGTFVLIYSNNLWTHTGFSNRRSIVRTAKYSNKTSSSVFSNGTICFFLKFQKRWLNEIYRSLVWSKVIKSRAGVCGGFIFVSN